MKPPARRYLSLVNCIFRNFPNREELLFRSVFALPKDSRMGEESTTFCSKPVTPPFERRVKYLDFSRVTSAVIEDDASNSNSKNNNNNNNNNSNGSNQR